MARISHLLCTAGSWLAPAAICLLTACGRDTKYYYAAFDRLDLVTDRDGEAIGTDANLVNPVGLQVSPSANFWVANNGTGTLTAYAPDGTAVPAEEPRVVRLPVPASLGADTLSRPTAIGYYGGSKLQIQLDGRQDSARYLVATEEGTILGYNAALDLGNAAIAVDNSATGAVYRGLTLASFDSSVRLYVTNFSAGTVEVFDGEFAPATDLDPAAFEDQELPPGYAPFGIQRVERGIYVTYAAQDSTGRNPVAGEGNGFVNLYGLDGRFATRVASGGALNVPFGITSSPWSFPYFERALLIGNHGDGRINAFSLWDGEFYGTLHTEDTSPLVIDGLWDIAFGPGFDGYYTLSFSAGPSDGQNGAFGSLTTQLIQTDPATLAIEP
jgi:uncharacterized protein (TIGR03118 family)